MLKGSIHKLLQQNAKHKATHFLRDMEVFNHNIAERHKIFLRPHGHFYHFRFVEVFLSQPLQLFRANMANRFGELLQVI